MQTHSLFLLVRFHGNQRRDIFRLRITLHEIDTIWISMVPAEWQWWWFDSLFCLSTFFSFITFEFCNFDAKMRVFFRWHINRLDSGHSECFKFMCLVIVCPFLWERTAYIRITQSCRTPRPLNLHNGISRSLANNIASAGVALLRVSCNNWRFFGSQLDISTSILWRSHGKLHLKRSLLSMTRTEDWAWVSEHKSY